MSRSPHPHPLKTDDAGRVLVVIAGGIAWVVDKRGSYQVLAMPEQQLGRHIDILTDPVFNVGTVATEPGWKNPH